MTVGIYSLALSTGLNIFKLDAVADEKSLLAKADAEKEELALLDSILAKAQHARDVQNKV